MTKHLRALALSLAAALFLTAALTPAVQAQNVTQITLADTQFVACNTFDGLFQGSFRAIAQDTSGAVVNAGSPLAFRVTATTVYGIETYEVSLSSSDTHNFAIAFDGSGTITQGSIQVALASNPAIATGAYVWDCASQSVIPGGSGPISNGGGATDGRLNPGYGDLINVLYPAVDAAGQPVLEVWGVNGDQGYRIGAFPAFIFARLKVAAPPTDLYVGSIAQTHLYALANGSIELRVGPNAEGKVYTLEIDDIPFSRVVFR